MMNEIQSASTAVSSGTLRDFVSECSDRALRSQALGTDDSVEISDLARFMQRISELPDVRLEKVASVRAAIQRGDYVTPEKLDYAVERMLSELEVVDSNQ